MAYVKKGKKKTIYELKILPKLDQISKMREEGFRTKDIANAIGVGERTLHTYINNKPELMELWGKSNTTLIEKLKNTLYDLALGKAEEIKIVETTEEKKGVIVKSRKYKEVRKLAPNLSAIVFALCNLDPNHWRRGDKDEITENVKLILADSIARIKEKQPKEVFEITENQEENQEEGVNVEP